MKHLILLLILTSPALGQSTGAALIALWPGVPSGTCRTDSRTLALNMATGSLYSCVSGGWMMVGMGGGGAGSVTSFSAGNASPYFTSSVTNPTTTPALSFTPYTAPNNTMLGNTSGSSAVPTWIPIPTPGGGGSVTSFSSGNLSPLFTTSVATATTTPALSFSLSNAPANTMLGNSTSSPATPSWIAIPQGGGGTNPLNGCQTATAGKLTCDNSLGVTTGNQAQMLMAFSGALPTPPSTAHAALVPDAQGEPNWSNGNSAPFEKLATTSDVSTAVSQGTLGLLPMSAFSTCNQMGWSVNAGAQTCSDLRANVQTGDAYTVGLVDLNHVIQNTLSGPVIDTLPLPAGNLAPPFQFWVDTTCRSSVTLEAGAGASVNGQSSVEIGACGWAFVWADQNGATWNAQIYSPPGGVTVIE